MFDNNNPEKGGSFYVQSKIFRAKETVFEYYGFVDEALSTKGEYKNIQQFQRDGRNMSRIADPRGMARLEFAMEGINYRDFEAEMRELRRQEKEAEQQDDKEESKWVFRLTKAHFHIVLYLISSDLIVCKCGVALLKRAYFSHVHNLHTV